MRILIVDDERPARERLHRLLAAQPDVSAIEQARDGAEALDRIASFRPDAVFLDIEMPGISGIDVAASLPDPAPLLVFVTAYDRYAVRAFDAEATDYLLKPYDGARFLRALERLRERLRQAPNNVQNGRLPQHAAPVERLLIPDRGVTRVVPVATIDWIETADNYVTIHTADAALLMRQTMAGLLTMLGDGFLRCHRRAAVRLAAIQSVITLDKGDAEIHLHGGTQVPCSRQYRHELLARLQPR